MTTMVKVNKIIVHQSVGPLDADIETVRGWHKDQGFDDIGYHYYLWTLFEKGPWTVAQGRDEKIMGAHDLGENVDSIGICIAGTYTDIELPEFDGWDLLVMTVTNVCIRHGLTSQDVYTHEENEPSGSTTKCAGFPPDYLRGAVARRLAEAW